MYSNKYKYQQWNAPGDLMVAETVVADAIATINFFGLFSPID